MGVGAGADSALRRRLAALASSARFLARRKVHVSSGLVDIQAGLFFQGERAWLLGEAWASTPFHTPGPMLQCDPALRPLGR